MFPKSVSEFSDMFSQFNPSLKLSYSNLCKIHFHHLILNLIKYLIIYLINYLLPGHPPGGWGVYLEISGNGQTQHEISGNG